MIAITYRLELLEPLLASALAGDPNSSVSYPFIPGSMIRGLIAGALATQPDIAAKERPLLFDGSVKYLHAYPADASWRRLLPTPLSMRQDKDGASQGGRVEDHALMPPSQTKLETPKALHGFVRLDLQNKYVLRRQPGEEVTVHTLRDRFAGRPTKDRGEVYRYEALPAGECLAGVILTANAVLRDRVMALLPAGDYRLGGAATAGYGLVRLSEIEEARPWSECEMLVRRIKAEEEFILCLLSDAILRDETGANHSRVQDAVTLPVKLEKAFRALAPVGGFNRTWGLPVPQEQAVRAGSVFVLRATQDITEHTLRGLIAEGVGERRVEGFGRLAINWQEEDILKLYEAVPPPVQVSSSVLSSAERELAVRMATRRRRKTLDGNLVRVINNLHISKAPPNSQLARVRILARSALHERDLGRISTLFKRKLVDDQRQSHPNPDAMKDTALKQFESARVGGERLSAWIIMLADTPTSVWQELGGEQRVKLGDIEPERWLAEEYAVRLIDGVLGNAMAQRRNQGGGR